MGCILSAIRNCRNFICCKTFKFSTQETTCKEFQLFVVGLHGCGKTSIIKRFTNGNNTENILTNNENNISPTIGIDVSFKYVVANGTQTRVQLTESMSLENEILIRAVKSIMTQSNVTLICFDLGDKQSFEKLKKHEYLFLHDKSVLIGLKSDLKQNISDEDITELITKYNLKYYHVSSKTDSNNIIKDLFIRFIT